MQLRDGLGRVWRLYHELVCSSLKFELAKKNYGCVACVELFALPSFQVNSSGCIQSPLTTETPTCRIPRLLDECISLTLRACVNAKCCVHLGRSNLSSRHNKSPSKSPSQHPPSTLPAPTICALSPMDQISPSAGNPIQSYPRAADPGKHRLPGSPILAKLRRHLSRR